MAYIANTYTEEDVLEVIRARIADADSLREVARQVEMSPAYLSDIKLGRRGISGEVAAKFGFERIVTTEIVFKKVAR
jgi:hypothetical protein